MPLKFSANLSWLFKEVDTLEGRYAAAQKAGFQAVESSFPFDTAVEVLSKAREEAGVEHVLINAWPGNYWKTLIGSHSLTSF